MPDDELTLEELSERTGVEARTLRSWVSEGLLAPPFRPGRGAKYPATNADRALAVRALKDVRGWPFSKIRHRLMMATEDQIHKWALEAGPLTAPMGSARDYLRRIQTQNTTEVPPPQRPMGSAAMKIPPRESERSSVEARLSKATMESSRRPRSDERQAQLATIERLILQMARVLEAPAPRRSRATVWNRISITPDLELFVRGDLKPHERFIFEQLVDHFRAILTGSSKDD